MLQVIPPKSLTLLQGIPGSGKSTMARKLLREMDTFGRVDTTGIILSTDDYWIVEHPSVSMAGTTVYKYDPAKAPVAHAWNQRRCIEEMQKGTNFIFIDNTNIEKWQAQPYIALAKMFDYEVRVVTVSVGLDEAKRRNKQRDFDRRIPEDVIESMHSRLQPLL